MQIVLSNGWPELNVDANKAHCHGLKVRPSSPHKGCAIYAIGFTPSGTMAAGGSQHNVQKGRLFENGGIIQQNPPGGLSCCSRPLSSARVQSPGL